MTRSLKQQYETRQVQQLRERISSADRQLITEQRTAELLVEAMNDDDLKKVAAIVQKLDTIKSPDLPKLTAAIEQAEAELNKYTAGGPITAAWTKMKKLVGIDNPIVKITTFADALERGFSQIPTILKNNGIDLKNADLTKSLVNALAGKKPTKAGTGPVKTTRDPSNLGNARFDNTAPSQNEAEASSQQIQGKLKTVVAQLQKALAPGGIYGTFKKVPYIASDVLAQELIKAPLKSFSDVAKKINSGTKAAEVATDLKSQVTGQGGAETKGTQASDVTKAGAQTQPAAPTKPSTTTSKTTPTGEETPKPQGGGASENHAAAKSKIATLLGNMKEAPGGFDGFIKKMLAAGLDPSKLPDK